MDERQLQYFLAIAELNSVTRAADKLNIAQPSLSQILLRLEEELQVKLFDRTSRGVMLTEAGHVFLGHARTILRAMASAREETRGEVPTVHSSVSVGFPSSISTLLGARLLVEAGSSLPHVSIKLSEAMSGHIRRWLEDGSLDLGILYNVKDLRTLTANQVATEELFLVGRPGDLGETDQQGIALSTVGVAKLLEVPLILPTTQHGLRQFVDQKARSCQVELKVEIELDSLTHIKSLVSQGKGYTLLAHAAIMDELADGKLSAARIARPVFRRGIFVVRSQAHVITKASVKVESLILTLMDRMIAEAGWLATRVAPSRG